MVHCPRAFRPFPKVPSAMTQPVVPRPASTITVVRDVAQGFEVLMMQRTHKAGFMPGVYVFPGGAVDQDDRDPDLYALCDGIDDAAASRRLGVERDGLAYWVAAIRECFEEAGLLLCHDRRGALVSLAASADEARFVAHRAALNAGSRAFIDVLREEGLRLATDRLTYFSHWITPTAAPKRFDTRFFVAVAPPAQSPLHDAAELIDHRWVRPQEAIELDDAGTFNLRTPTKTTLKQLGKASGTGPLIEMLAAQKEIRAVLPVVSRDGGRLLPGDAGYDEAARNPVGKWK